MKIGSKWKLCAAAAFMALMQAAPVLVRPARGDQEGETIRRVVEKYQGAVVTLQFVVKSAVAEGGADSGREMEAHGIVINSSGLVVTNLSSIDSTSMMAGMMGINEGGESSSKVVNVKIVTQDGDEYSAKVVLRDQDRNLAFIRPLTAPAHALPYVNLAAAGRAQLGDPVFVMGRMGKAGNRSISTMTSRIISIFDKPQLYYALDSMMFLHLDSVVFNEQGEPLGIASVRVAPAHRTSDNLSDYLVPVVLPAEDVMEVARQAPQAKDVHEGSGHAAAAPVKKAPRH